MISRYFASVVGDEFPDTLNISLKKVEHLRYGENSQQAANKYEDAFVKTSLLDYEQLHGKEIFKVSGNSSPTTPAKYLEIIAS